MAGALRSGQITVTTAGTAVAGPSTPNGTLWAIKAHPDNTDTVWFGNDGADDITSSNGFPLDAGETIIVETTPTGTLAEYYFDSDVNGEKLAWIKLA